MNKTSIEWVKNPDGTQGYTWNPITGCLNGCEYCYARKLANGRLKPLYLANENYATSVDFRNGVSKPNVEAFYDPFYPRFWERKLDQPFLRKKPSGIFTCDMSDLFGTGIPKDWTIRVLDVIRQCPQHRFYLLTKQGRNLYPWSPFIPKDWTIRVLDVIRQCPQHRFYLLTKQGRNLYPWSPFPENCWVGITATGYLAFNRALDDLKAIDAKVKYLSIEPLLERVNFYAERLIYCGVKWVITGACTGTLEDIKKLLMLYPQLTPMPYGKKWTAQPKIEWVEEIVQACDKAGVKVFQKDNLKPLLGDKLRQELPK